MPPQKPSPIQTLERPLNEDELAQALGRKKRTLQKDRLLGRGVPYIKIGRSVRYLPSDIIDYLNRCPRGGQE
jgi:hypothetical protein